MWCVPKETALSYITPQFKVGTRLRNAYSAIKHLDLIEIMKVREHVGPSEADVNTAIFEPKTQNDAEDISNRSTLLSLHSHNLPQCAVVLSRPTEEVH